MFKFKRAVLCQLLLICSLLMSVPAAFAAGSISIRSAGNSTYNVVASGIPSPSAVHVVVGYDATLLSNPQVTQGAMASGAFFVTNANVPGSIQIAVAAPSAMKGTGILASITFTQTGSTPGTITVRGGTANPVIDQNAKNIPVTYGYYVPDQQDTSSTSTASSSTGAGSASGTGTGDTSKTADTVTRQTGSGSNLVGGTLTMPGDDTAVARKETPTQQAPQESRETTLPVPVPSSEAAAPEAAVAAKKVEKYQVQNVTSVLEKFRLFTGEKTPQSLSALFTPDATFVQTPTIGISDGKTTMIVQIAHVPGERAPNFAFSHARYVALQQTGEGEWQLELKPDKNTIRAGITMTVGGVEQEIPLTVLPKANVDLDKSGSVTEADFLRFLKERGTEKAPRYDLNGDGRRDYQDDYIFTGNYLLQKDAKPAAAPKK